MSSEVEELRRIVQENIRVQRGGSDAIEYVDVSRALADIAAKQNHVVFGRRGCGKTLLLQATQQKTATDVKVVYINCEDYKQHSFPNVLIEILDALFEELEKNLSGWFGKKKRSRELIGNIRKELAALKQSADEAEKSIRESQSVERRAQAKAGAHSDVLQIGAEAASARKAAIEYEYKQYDNKIEKLNLLLPNLKRQIREFFALSVEVKSVFIQLDDFYHLPRAIQPHVTDYVHRLCKDLPLYFNNRDSQTRQCSVRRQGRPAYWRAGKA